MQRFGQSPGDNDTTMSHPAVSSPHQASVGAYPPQMLMRAQAGVARHSQTSSSPPISPRQGGGPANPHSEPQRSFKPQPPNQARSEPISVASRSPVVSPRRPAASIAVTFDPVSPHGFRHHTASGSNSRRYSDVGSSASGLRTALLDEPYLADAFPFHSDGGSAFAPATPSAARSAGGAGGGGDDDPWLTGNGGYATPVHSSAEEKAIHREAMQHDDDAELLASFRWVLMFAGFLPLDRAFSSRRLATEYQDTWGQTSETSLWPYVRLVLAWSYPAAIFALWWYRIYWVLMVSGYQYTVERVAWTGVFLLAAILQAFSIYTLVFRRFLQRGILGVYEQCIAYARFEASQRHKLQRIATQTRAASPTFSGPASPRSASGSAALPASAVAPAGAMPPRTGTATAVHTRVFSFESSRGWIQRALRVHTQLAVVYTTLVWLLLELGSSNLLNTMTLNHFLILFTSFQMFLAVNAATFSQSMVFHVIYYRYKQLMAYALAVEVFQEAPHMIEWVMRTKDALFAHVKVLFVRYTFRFLALLFGLATPCAIIMMVLFASTSGQYPGVFPFTVPVVVLLDGAGLYAVVSKPYRHYFMLHTKMAKLSQRGHRPVGEGKHYLMTAGRRSIAAPYAARPQEHPPANFRSRSDSPHHESDHDLAPVYPDGNPPSSSSPSSHQYQPPDEQLASSGPLLPDSMFDVTHEPMSPFEPVSPREASHSVSSAHSISGRTKLTERFLNFVMALRQEKDANERELVDAGSERAANAAAAPLSPRQFFPFLDTNNRNIELDIKKDEEAESYADDKPLLPEGTREPKYSLPTQANVKPTLTRRRIAVWSIYFNMVREAILYLIMWLAVFVGLRLFVQYPSCIKFPLLSDGTYDPHPASFDTSTCTTAEVLFKNLDTTIIGFGAIQLMPYIALRYCFGVNSRGFKIFSFTSNILHIIVLLVVCELYGYHSYLDNVGFAFIAIQTAAVVYLVGTRLYWSLAMVILSIFGSMFTIRLCQAFLIVPFYLRAGTDSERLVIVLIYHPILSYGMYLFTIAVTSFSIRYSHGILHSEQFFFAYFPACVQVTLRTIGRFYLTNISNLRLGLGSAALLAGMDMTLRFTQPLTVYLFWYIFRGREVAWAKSELLRVDHVRRHSNYMAMSCKLWSILAASCYMVVIRIHFSQPIEHPYEFLAFVLFQLFLAVISDIQSTIIDYYYLELSVDIWRHHQRRKVYLTALLASIFCVLLYNQDYVLLALSSDV